MPYIYALSDPRTGAVRYVGQTVSAPAVRLKNHLTGARRGYKRSHSACWIVSLLAVGVRPELRVLQEAPVEEIDAAEVAWIAKAPILGWDLVNHHPGGRNGGRGLRHRPATIERMREAAKARGNNRTGTRHTPETVEKIKAGNAGRKRTAEQRERIRLAHVKRFGILEGVTDASRRQIIRKRDDGASLRALAARHALSRRAIERVLAEGLGTV